MIRMTLSARCVLDASALILICVFAVFSFPGCERGGTTAQSGVKAGLTNDAPEIVAQPAAAASETALLLLDDAEQDGGAAGATADNSRCFVCHVNYMEEQIAANHARRDIGCIRCHGPSDAHIADESWASGGNGTAPDIMYPRDKINPACMTCHPRDKLSILKHEVVIAGSDPRVCTDCHGEHRLPKRRCKWR
jgi:hypothetical protein